MANLKLEENVDSTLYGKSILPTPGTIMMFAGNTAPSGWFLCNGGTFSQSSNPELFLLLGSSTTLPDLRSDYLLGSNAAGTSSNVTGHVHNANYAAVNTNNVNVDGTHGHTTNNAQLANSSNATHGHYYSLTVEARYGFNNGNKQGTNQGNLTNTDHQHFANWYGTFGRNVNPNHAHYSTSSSLAGTNLLSHSHTASISTNASVFGAVATTTIPQTKYFNYIIKGG